MVFLTVTNQMGQTEGDFEKGQAQGSLTTLRILRQTTADWEGSLRSQVRTTGIPEG